METPVVETTPTAEAPPPVAEQVDAPSIADHAAQFDPDKPQDEPDKPLKVAKETSTPTPANSTDADAAKPSHEQKRAAKQVASREDAPRIQELTRKLREAERKAAELEARISTPRSDPAAAAPVSAKTSTFTKPEPKLADFAMEDDPHTAWTDARQDWRTERMLHDAREQVTARQQAEAQRIAVEQGQQLEAEINGKISEFTKTHPDYWEKIEAVEDLLAPDVLLHTIATSDNPAELGYYFATHTDDYVAAIGFAASLDLSAPSVALLRRYLNRYTRATDATPNGSTGAPTPAPSRSVAPKPLTPVGTGPLSTGDVPTGEVSSIADHAKHFGPKPRRR